MAPLDHRNPGILGAVLLASDISCELIADNIHVHPEVMKILHRLKGSHRIILVTDAVRPTGLKEGKYKLGDETVTYHDGAIRLKDGTLAGSALTLEKGLMNFIQATGCRLDETWQCACLNPAKLLGIDDKKGSIEVGKDADLILVDEKFDVHLTMIGGNVVFSAKIE
jgi:N-acetylglucosamine-6-phosphate deacetylase